MFLDIFPCDTCCSHQSLPMDGVVHGVTRPVGQVDEDEGEAQTSRRDEGEQGEFLRRRRQFTALPLVRAQTA